MPELPEVETIKLGLERKIVGLIIRDIEVLTPKSAQFHPQVVIGKKVLKIWRRAKILGVDLSGNTTLLIHLKMTGQLILDKKAKNNDQPVTKLIGGHPTGDMFQEMPNKSTRVVFQFDDESVLYFNDQRKFGWIKTTETTKIKDQKELINLGVEPLGERFTWEILKQQLLRRKKTPVKVALMDQELVAGIGNIYASESLFLAKINPRKMVKDLTDEDFKLLARSIKDSLELSLKHGGSTRAHYVDVEGRKGRFLDFAYVYNRKGDPCKVCGELIAKSTQAGRSTFYCPHCQK